RLGPRGPSGRPGPRPRGGAGTRRTARGGHGSIVVPREAPAGEHARCVREREPIDTTSSPGRAGARRADVRPTGLRVPGHPGGVRVTGRSGLRRPARERAAAGVARGVVQRLLDAQELVVLVDALAAGGGTGLDLAGV